MNCLFDCTEERSHPRSPSGGPRHLTCCDGGWVIGNAVFPAMPQVVLWRLLIGGGTSLSLLTLTAETVPSLLQGFEAASERPCCWLNHSYVLTCDLRSVCYNGLIPAWLLFREVVKVTIALGTVATDTKHLVDLEIQIMSVLFLVSAWTGLLVVNVNLLSIMEHCVYWKG